MHPLIWLVGISLAMWRPVFAFREFNKHINQSYQAVSHILVGVLGTLWFVNHDVQALVLLLFLTVVEVACATLTVIEKRRKGTVK